MAEARPFHERIDVFAAIAAMAEHKGSSAYDANVATARFHGALMMFHGTAIPKGHDDLGRSIIKCARALEMQADPLVLRVLDWIGAEKERFEGPPYKGGRLVLDGAFAPTADELSPLRVE